MSSVVNRPSSEALERTFRLKHGDPGTTGWAPQTRHRLGYYTPDDIYEALVDGLVGPDCVWADVGCGHDPFPENRQLARDLADRCELLVGVDPDETLEENPFVHRRVRAAIEDLEGDWAFSLVTLRMVAEHITRPEQAARALARITRPGAKVVVYTVNRWSPVALATRLIPFGLHHPIKKVVWGTEARDTFPVAYRMNTRRRLSAILRAHGFEERFFTYLDDCRTFARFKLLGLAELMLWRVLRGLGWHYPENCLLGVYERL